MAIHEKITIEELLSIKKLTRTQALSAIEGKGLSEEETEQVLKMALKDPSPKETPQWAPNDASLWMAVAHLLGASFSEIASDYHIARQSVMARVDRVLPVTHRAPMRLAVSLSLESYSEYKVAFFENLSAFEKMQPLEVARILKASTSLDSDDSAA